MEIITLNLEEVTFVERSRHGAEVATQMNFSTKTLSLTLSPTRGMTGILRKGVLRAKCGLADLESAPAHADLMNGFSSTREKSPRTIVLRKVVLPTHRTVPYRTTDHRTRTEYCETPEPCRSEIMRRNLCVSNTGVLRYLETVPVIVVWQGAVPCRTVLYHR